MSEIRVDVLKYRFSLGNKLFIFICLILLLIILPFFYIAKTSLSDFGYYASLVNKTQIKKMSTFYLSQIADEKAKTYDAVFKKIEAASCLLGTHATDIYHHLDTVSKVPLKKISPLEWHQTNHMFFSPRHEAVVTAFWGGDVISDEINRELAALSHLKPMLMKSKEQIPESLATHIITASGIGCYYTTDMKARTACYNLPDSSEFDLRQGEPVTMFTKQDIKYFDTLWTNIYKDDVIDGMMMTASTPIYDRQGNFMGITGIDIPVRYIISDLIQGAFVSQNTTESILFAFLLNKNGQIIAFPKEFFSLFGLDIDVGQFENSGDILNHGLKDSSIPSVRNIETIIGYSPQGVIDLPINQEKYLLAVGHLGSVGWNLVLVAREADMTASVHKTGFALRQSLQTIWKEFMGHSFLILILSMVSIFCAIRVFIFPIRQFIEATQKVEKGEFSLILPTDRTDEIGLLAGSFHSMVKKLKISDQKEQENARELENKIKLRTIELEQTNNELNTVKHELEQTVARRTAQLKKVNEHLVHSEEWERKAIASDLHDSVTQTLAMSISKLKNIQESDQAVQQQDLLDVQGYLEQSVREIRSLIYQLSPPILDDFDIEIALGFLIEETNTKHHSDFHYINNTQGRVRVDQAVKVTIYRAVSELLTNILKHSGSKTGEIEISNTNREIRVRVEDQGYGFDLENLKKTDLFCFGLNSLSERLENFGGKINVHSILGKGTRIDLSIPATLKKDGENG